MKPCLLAVGLVGAVAVCGCRLEPQTVGDGDGDGDADAATDGSELQWFDTNYTRRKQVSMSPTITLPTASLVGFPMLVKISDAEIGATASPDGSDLLFVGSDQTQVLDFEIISYQAGQLTAYVVVSELSAASPPSFFLYYDSDQPQSAPATSEVWTGHDVVLHLEDDAYESSINPLSAFREGSVPAVAGILGGAVAMGDGTISYADDPVLDVGNTDFTVVMWVNGDTPLDAADTPLWKGGNEATRAGYDFELGSGAWQACVADGASQVCAGFGEGSSLTGAWRQLAIQVDRTDNTLETFVDGASISSVTLGELGSLANDDPLVLGGNTLGDVFAGAIDEVRVFDGLLGAEHFSFDRQLILSASATVSLGGEQTL